jgi:hypothetical protein
MVTSKLKVEDFAEFRAHVKAVCQDYQRLFFKTHYTMEFVWAETKMIPGQEEGEETIAEIDIHEKYLSFKIHLYRPAWLLWKDGHQEQLDDYLLHEFCHFFFSLHDEWICKTEKYLIPEHVENFHYMVEQQTELVKNVLMNVSKSLQELRVKVGDVH